MRITVSFVLLSSSLYIMASHPARGQGRPPASAALEVPSIYTIKRVDRNTTASRTEMETRCFSYKTDARLVKGDAYVIVTDHQDEGFLQPLRRLAKHHAGVILQVDDLANLSRKQEAWQDLKTRLRQANPRFVAIAPRLQNFRENLMLGLWEMFSSFDGEPGFGVFPSFLVAPNQRAFEALIDRSIRYQPQSAASFRPFLVGQITDSSPVGQRSLQKVEILKDLFAQCGYQTPSLIVRTFQARRSADAQPTHDQQWEVSIETPRPSLAQLPPAPKQAMDESSLLLMFGHGVPGMTCSLEVSAFQDVKMADKVVLCGSCFSAAPMTSDFPAMRRGADGSEVRNDRERFVMRALENGAAVVYGHMRENGGFPEMYPVLEAWMQGLTVGEACQRQMSAIIDFNGFKPGEFVLRAEDAQNQRAVMRRNVLLYVIIGDPALKPFEKIITAK